MFDADFFKLSPIESSIMDPHQRLLLECSYTAFANAGCSKDDLLGSDTGVYVGFGVSAADWPAVMSDRGLNRSAFASHASGHAATAGRLSYLLGLKGPCFSIDTACSASLVAMDVASQALRNGKCSTAVSAGKRHVHMVV